MKQPVGITTILWVLSSITFTAGTSSAESGSAGRPIQVVSDPYSVGNPTHYSIVKGTTKVTFSHPLAGQFVRAEVVVREKMGTKLTRFVLSSDRKTYRPSLQLETPFEKHNLLSEKEEVCSDPNAPAPITLVQVLKGKVNDGEVIAKKREELTKSKFFDASCWEPDFGEEHRNALFNATADAITTSTQNTLPEPKYLRCMEKYGFAHEAGIIQALIKQSITDTKVNPRVRIGCTTDKKAKPGEFDDGTRAIWIKKTIKPVREDYAAKVFHELLHGAPVSDGFPMAATEECCTSGEQCEVLKAYGKRNHLGTLKVTIAESVNPKASVATSEVTSLLGVDNESRMFGGMSKSTSQFESVAEVVDSITQQCRIVGRTSCDSQVTAAMDSFRISSFEAAASAGMCKPKNAYFQSPNFDWTSLIYSTAVADANEVTCETEVLSGTTRSKVEAAMKQTADDATITSPVPQTSPIEWDAQKAVPLRMANNGGDPADATATTVKPPAPSRTIASVSPLPDEAPQRQLGSASNRADVAQTSRASAIVDTMENAARNVAKTLTPERLDQLKVDKTEIFQASYKPKTKTPQYFVASAATGPMKVADIGDLKSLEFKNPFANVKQKVDRSTGAFTTIDLQPASSKKSVATTGAKADKSAFAQTEPTAQNDPSSKTGSANSPGAGTAGGTGVASGSAPASPTMLPGSNPSAKDRAPSATKKHDFKKMDRDSLIKFVTSSYRNVSPELENPELNEALSQKGIKIVDHENRPIGSIDPQSTFIYSQNVGRLVPTRAAK